MTGQKPVSPLFPHLGFGLGLRPSHYSSILEAPPPQTWFEAIAENYMGTQNGNGGRPLSILEKVRENHDVVLHGVSLSIGSTDELSTDYLKKLKLLCDRIQPRWNSDHVCWTGVEGENLHDLLPLPYTEEALEHLVKRISRVQDFLGRRMLFENVSTYLTYSHSEMTEWEFLSELAQRADCGLLLDVNNIYVSSQNLGFDPNVFLAGIPADRVGQIHLAGHSVQETPTGTCLIDTHDHPVNEAVWDLYRETNRRFAHVSTMVEWDAQIPSLEVLNQELAKARAIRSEIL
jgi:uncharacterized protein (UPF0276 family)